MKLIIPLVLKRLAIGLFSLFVVSVLIFIGVEALPGDLAEAILGQSATPETVAAFRRELALDQSPHVRYQIWITNLLQGDLGTSLANGQEIAGLLAGRLANTFFLAGVTAVVAVPLAISLGVISAIYRGGPVDRLVSIFSLAAISFPEFFIAYLLTLLLSVQINLFPGLARIDDSMTFLEQLNAIALPVITLSLVVTAHMMRMTRAAIINVLAMPYIEMAHLKGLGRRRIILRHAMPNALSPVINVVVLNLAYLVVGVVLVEVVFAYPGLGQLLIDSVSKRDLPVVQASCLVFAATYILLNLLADVLSILSNPRLRRRR
jgi:peptide/nickel transport system permease protein